VFFGEAKTHVGHGPGWRMTLPLVVLSFLSVVAGFINLPPGLGSMPIFSQFIETAVPAAAESHHGAMTEHMSMYIAMTAFAAGLFAAYWFFLRRPQAAESLASGAIGGSLHRFWLSGWGFDALYDRLFVRPLMWTAKVNKDDFVDAIYTALALIVEVFHRALSLTETGRVRWYAAGIVAGSLAFVAMALFL
jgi:NADH-quinone oxidoreductase subunit L